MFHGEPPYPKRHRTFCDTRDFVVARQEFFEELIDLPTGGRRAPQAMYANYRDVLIRGRAQEHTKDQHVPGFHLLDAVKSPQSSGCKSAGCNASDPGAEARRRSLATHFGGMRVVNRVQGQSICLWEGCMQTTTWSIPSSHSTGTSISREELGLISERLGEQGESIAKARFEHRLKGPMPSSATIAGPLPHPPAHQPHLIPHTPLASSAPAPTDVPVPGPTPASVSTAGPSHLASTQSASSPTVLGKRRADPSASENALPAKRTRGPPPVPQGEVTCRWDGCTETVSRGRPQEHVRHAHFRAVPSKNELDVFPPPHQPPPFP
ncbi:hypothetical protein PYCCODRAFT_1306922 [Trametes coccinea BRFM310]|uniref:Uncharacterized protein n=1 Tax=Trametes coccinea (strain BRFM310) TaxID=1353009 RepID=A0A1Y2I9A5_TRAC3|nr:hypothetical protein PYCCODRAFT_1306922 [Trametes coccinea BRFM310]